MRELRSFPLSLSQAEEIARRVNETSMPEGPSEPTHFERQYGTAFAKVRSFTVNGGDKRHTVNITYPVYEGMATTIGNTGHRDFA